VDLFYNKFYRALASRKEETAIFNLLLETAKEERLRGQRILNFLKNNIKLKKGLVFDLGAGTGGVLSIFKDAGFETFGVDLNANYLKFGIEQGLNLKKGGIEEFLKYPEKANIIILSHVLEHIHDPNKHLKRMWDCLKPEGYLLVIVPGFLNLHKGYKHLMSTFVFEHLYYFY